MLEACLTRESPFEGVATQLNLVAIMELSFEGTPKTLPRGRNDPCLVHTCIPQPYSRSLPCQESDISPPYGEHAIQLNPTVIL